MRAPPFRPVLFQVLFLGLPMVSGGALAYGEVAFLPPSSPEILSESWEGSKGQAAGLCRVQHSELSRGEPELSVWIPLLDQEAGGDSLSGKLFIPGMDYEQFKALLYGDREATWQSPDALDPPGFYTFIGSATGASAKKSGRTVIIEGKHVVAGAGGNPPRILRRTRLTLDYKKNEMSITLRHTKLGAFGVWIVVYSGSCESLKRVEPSSAAAAALAEYGRGMGQLLRSLLGLRDPSLESGVQAVRELREQVELALKDVREAKSASGRSEAFKRLAEQRPRRVEDLERALVAEGSDAAPILGAESKSWSKLSEMMVNQPKLDARGE